MFDDELLADLPADPYEALGELTVAFRVECVEAKNASSSAGDNPEHTGIDVFAEHSYTVMNKIEKKTARILFIPGKV